MPRLSLPRHTARVAAALATVALVSPARAQLARPTVGVSAASFAWKDGRREQAVGLVTQLAPAPWLLLGATPTALRVQGTDGGPSRAGLSDLPVFAGITHAFAAPWTPSLGAAASAILPTGNVDRGLGRGTTLVSAEATLGVSPLPALTLRGGASRLVRDGGLLPAGAPRSALFGDAVVGIGSRTNASVGLVAELAGTDRASWTPARSVNAAVVRNLVGPTALLASAGRSLRGAGPAWSFSLGIGTAFGGLSPIGASSVRGRDPVGATPGASPRTTPGGVPLGHGPLCTLTGSC